MIEFIVVAIFLVAIWFFLKSRKKRSPSIKNAPESAKPIKQTPQHTDKVAKTAEAVTTPAKEKVSPTVTQAAVVENKPVIAPQQTISLESSLLPQDSMLRRHYLTHVRAMITSLSPSRPAELALSRHYDAQITADIERCLNNKMAMDQLIADYANYKKTLIRPVTESQPNVAMAVADEETQAIIEPSVQIETVTESSAVVPQHKVSKVPKDSMLRRHYLTNLYSQVAANMSPRPTDSTLRRHYDSMLEHEVNNQLSK
jgi:hypothetical protein